MLPHYYSTALVTNLVHRPNIGPFNLAPKPEGGPGFWTRGPESKKTEIAKYRGETAKRKLSENIDAAKT